MRGLRRDAKEFLWMTTVSKTDPSGVAGERGVMERGCVTERSVEDYKRRLQDVDDIHAYNKQKWILQ